MVPLGVGVIGEAGSKREFAEPAVALGQNDLFSQPVLDRATEIYKAVALMTDTKSRNMIQIYRFDVSVRLHIGPLSSEDVCELLKAILRRGVLLTRELKSVDWKIAPSPTMCLARVLRRF